MKYINLKKMFYGFMTAAGSVLFSASVYANIELGQIGNNIATNTDGMSQGLYSAGIFIGVAFAIGGIIGLATYKKTNTPLSYSMIALLAGVLLTSVTAVLGSGSATIFGSTENDLDQIGL